MDAFRPTWKTTHCVIESRKDPVWLPPQLNFTSRRHTGSAMGWDPDIVQDAIAESTTDVLRTIARRSVMRDPKRKDVLVVSKDDLFVPEVSRLLVPQLGLVSPELAVEPLRALAHDLRAWALEQTVADHHAGIFADRATGEVFVRCPDAAPQISSLARPPGA